MPGVDTVTAVARKRPFDENGSIREDAATMLVLCVVVPGERQLRQMRH
ncbi:MAG TPA: hypothetical protein VGL27_02150 [Negativicutes bacterium]